VSREYFSPLGPNVALFANEDRTVWEGSVEFDPCYPGENNKDCCASQLEISAGECEDDICISMPVIVDSCPPAAEIEVDDSEACDCEGISVTFKSLVWDDCEDTECCGDDCSGFAGWSMAFYDVEDGDPFDKCCETPCGEPVDTCSDSDCPIECVTDCLEENLEYYVIVNLVDEVGNEQEYYAIMELDTDEVVSFVEYQADKLDGLCTHWDTIIGDDGKVGQCGEDIEPCPVCD